jgi:hypothetical protein
MTGATISKPSSQSRVLSEKLATVEEIKEHPKRFNTPFMQDCLRQRSPVHKLTTYVDLRFSVWNLWKVTTPRSLSERVQYFEGAYMPPTFKSQPGYISFAATGSR